jgi:hypothetical protein
LNAKFQGWTFVIPSFKYANINRWCRRVAEAVAAEGRAGQGCEDGRHEDVRRSG